MVKLGLAWSGIYCGHGRWSARKLLEKTWQRTFEAAGLAYAVHDFGGECSMPEIEQAKTAALAANAQVIIGAGGGKVLDTSRAVAAALNKPSVNCPTVASSDAPCSALSVVYKDNGEFDSYFFYKRNPDLVLVDIDGDRPGAGAAIGCGHTGDALATWFEAKTVIDARAKNQVGGATTISAGALARLCYETLLDDGVLALEAVRAKVVTPSLERLVEANTFIKRSGF